MLAQQPITPYNKASLDSSPLPEDPALLASLSPRVRANYERCLRQQDALVQQLAQESSPSVKKQLFFARVAGFMIIYGPNSEDRDRLCPLFEQGDSIEDVGQDLFELLICSFAKYQSFVPQMSLNDREEGKSPSSAQRVATKALQRDQHRCVLTGFLDRKYVSLNRIVGVHHRECVGSLILPQTMCDIKDDRARKLWSVIARLGFPDLREEMVSRDLSPKNILTLSLTAQADFSRLRVWLEPTEVANQYSVRMHSYISYEDDDLVEKVTFMPDGEHEIPDRRLLELHAACCRVAWMAGAETYLAKFWIEEEIRVEEELWSMYDEDDDEVCNNVEDVCPNDNSISDADELEEQPVLVGSECLIAQMADITF